MTEACPSQRKGPPSPRTVRFQFNLPGLQPWAGHHPHQGGLLFFTWVLRENSQTILGISLSPCPHPSLAPQGPCQESHLVLQLCVMTPSLVKEWPSVLHDQLLLGTCRGTAKDI